MTKTILCNLFILSSISYLCGEIQEPYKSIKVLPFDSHGWFRQGNQKNLNFLISKYKPKVIVELGTWLGSSAIFMASRLDEDGKLYSVDDWTASSDQSIQLDKSVHSKLPTLYQQFLSNVIHHNLTDKIIPVRMKTLEAAKALNIKADLIYVDASHDEESVFNDIMHWHPKLNPQGIMCGDDWYAPSVQKGVQKAARILKQRIKSEGNFWYFSHDLTHNYKGQFGQDKFVNEHFFKDKRNGIFLDIGAYDGISHSNTYFFEKELGWHGICFEPLEKPFKELSSIRNCICLNCCVADQDKPVKFFKVDGAPIMLSGISDTYDPRHFQRMKYEVERDGGSYEITTIQARALNPILQEHSIFNIDFLSLDTEGSELKILRSIDFDKFFIHVITVENNYNNIAIRAFLSAKGYTFVTKLLQDEIYIHSKSPYLAESDIAH